MPEHVSPLPVLGAILAGGRSLRFGSPKALARVGGRRIVDRVVEAMREVVPDPVLIANDPELYADLELPTRGDAVPGRGALSGIHRAVLWARELNRPGALCVASDMPFLHGGLIRLVLERAHGGALAVAPRSPSRHGVEPLCAWYSVAALPLIEARLESGRLALGGLLSALATERIPPEVVAGFGDPAVLFLNVNTRDELALAERITTGAEGVHGGP